MNTLQNLSLICFDLDGTLAESKSPLDSTMSTLLCQLLEKTKVVVASGASFDQFEKQFLNHLTCNEEQRKNLYLLPTNGATLYEYKDSSWNLIYSKEFTEEEKGQIFKAFEKSFEETGWHNPPTLYGELIEDRKAQITFSAFGSTAPLSLKENWDKDHAKREKIVESLKKYIPEFSIKIGGTTSIDITKESIDKAYGLAYIMEYLSIPKENVLYVGDALFPGGNDSSVIRLGIQTHQVDTMIETRDYVGGLLLEI